ISITPAVNLVANIGFGGNATHTGGKRQYHNLLTTPMDDPRVPPVETIVDRKADDLFYRKRILPETPMAKRLAQRPLRWAARKLRGSRLRPLRRAVSS
ncbi:MAG: hypothetical protein MI723_14865, partial [Caulobacterales bacterium]|nr:hypothetical protein [Caulobacterales bacterium]